MGWGNSVQPGKVLAKIIQKDKRMAKLAIDPGLEGLVVGETYISHVDGKAGRLIYRDTNVAELVNLPFADVASLVVTGAIQADVSEAVNRGIALTPAERQWVLALPRAIHPMQVLQAITPLLSRNTAFDFLTVKHLGGMAQGATITPETLADARHALSIAVRLPEVIATHLLGREVGNAVAADTLLARFLAWIDAPDSADARQGFEVMQILQLEHSFNASTFAARVIASTLAPIENALSGAIGTLHGVLHGGADQAALETADQVGSAAAAPGFVDDCLARGIKVMGMGHREYQVVDPRAVYAKDFAQRVTQGTEHAETFATLQAIEQRFTERMAEKNKALYANIEFYKGLVFRSLGLPPAFFTPMFAMARVYGYTAHVLEARLNNRLIRPAARYLGNWV